MKRLLIILFILIPIICEGQGFIFARRNVVTASSSGPPLFLSADGNTWGWYLSTDSVVKDGSNYVSRWGDYLNSTHDLIQATAAAQPLWSSDGILGDGDDDFMTTGLVDAFHQPATIYIVVKQITWTDLDAICDGYGGTAGMIRQHTSTPRLSLTAATYTTDNAALAVGTWGIVTAVVNGTSSFFEVVDTNNGTENAGTNNPHGFTLFAFDGGSARWSNVQVKEVIIRSVADDVSNRASVKAYLKAKYGL